MPTDTLDRLSATIRARRRFEASLRSDRTGFPELYPTAARRPDPETQPDAA